MSKPLARRPVRIVWAIAALAMSSTGIVVSQATTPSGTVVAECINGEVVDPDTGTCPQQPPTSVQPQSGGMGGGTDLSSNPAVGVAEAENESSVTLADEG